MITRAGIEIVTIGAITEYLLYIISGDYIKILYNIFAVLDFHFGLCSLCTSNLKTYGHMAFSKRNEQRIPPPA